MPKEAPYGYDVRVQRAPEPHAHLVVHRQEELHAAARRADRGRRGDEAVRQPDGRLGLPRAQAAPDPRACPGAPLEIRWALQPHHNYAFTATALTGKLVLIEQQEDGTWASQEHRRDRRQHSRWTSASRPTTASSSSTRSGTARSARLRRDEPARAQAGRDRRRSASRPTWCRSRGTASASTSPPRCSPSGTSPATTGSRPTPGRTGSWWPKFTTDFNAVGAGAHHEPQQQDVRPARRRAPLRVTGA